MFSRWFHTYRTGDVLLFDVRRVLVTWTEVVALQTLKLMKRGSISLRCSVKVVHAENPESCVSVHAETFLSSDTSSSSSAGFCKFPDSSITQCLWCVLVLLAGRTCLGRPPQSMRCCRGVSAEPANNIKRGGTRCRSRLPQCYQGAC